MRGSLLALIAALLVTGCSGGWASGNGYYVEFGAGNCRPESVPLAERATPTQEYMTPAPTATPTPVGEFCTVDSDGGAFVREAPNAAAGKVGLGVKDKTPITVIDRRDGWVFAREYGGWIYGELVRCN